MTCPICKRLYCDHSPEERGQSFDEMIEDMRTPHIINDDGLTQRVTQSEYDERMRKSQKDYEPSAKRSMAVIRRMELCDLDEVKKIQDSYDYWKMNLNKSQKGGFFIKLLSEEEFAKSIIPLSSSNFVYRSGERTEGYIMASFRNNTTADDRIKRASYNDNSLGKKLLEENHLFAQYVAKRKHANSKIILNLEQEIYNEAINNNCKHVVALISLNPYNKKSWEFHKRLGWKQIGKSSEQIKEQVIEWSVVYRTPQLST